MEETKPCCTLELSEEDETHLLKMFKAAGNPIRFAILKYLIEHPGCITGDIVEYLPIAQATVSQHLKVLRDAGFIQGEISGTATKYCLNEKHIRWFSTKVEEIF